jgi:PIN domain nuclease of toxin-antitoxin system
LILLDTNAVLWLERRHSRSRPLTRWAGRLYLSPASLLELKFLAEAGRIRLRSGLDGLAADGRWLLDDPPAAAWFRRAQDLGWTRDPFDRLLTAHAQLRGWRLATGDSTILDVLDAGEVVEL